MALGGEVGELQNSFKKAMRDENYPTVPLRAERRLHLLLELGDVLWYLAATAAEFGVTLEEIAGMNAAKLAKREANG